MNCIYSLLELNNCTIFYEAIVNLAVNSPDEFYSLLTDVLHSYSSGDSPFEVLYDRRETFSFEDERFIPVSDEEALERFAQRSAEDFAKIMKGRINRPFHQSNFCQSEKPSGRKKKNKVTEKDFPDYFVSPDLENVIYRLHCNRAAEAVIFLLEKARPDVRKAFFNNFLSPKELARRAEADIVVRHIEDDHLIRGNQGRYVIFARKGDQERLLRFTNQPSCVYYLMYLIHRHQHDGFLAPLDLGTNKEEFMKLYLEVYDMPQSMLEQRFKDLMYRMENGRRRAGRMRELIYDIRQHVEWALAEFDEASSPYVMTAFRHLTIDKQHIIFEDQKLLQYQFK